MKCMPSSIKDYLEEGLDCEELLECISGSSNLDKEIYFLVLEKNKEMDIDRIAEEVSRERSTAYRAVQRLKENGFLQQEKINQEGGGYRHVYNAVKPEKVAEQMQDKLNEWYAEVGQLIFEFKKKYGSEETENKE